MLGDNLVAAVRGQEPVEYRHKHVGSVASLGLHKGVGQVYGIKIKGWPAWFMHRTYHMSRMPTFNRKVRIVLDWTLALFFRRELVPWGGWRTHGPSSGPQPHRRRRARPRASSLRTVSLPAATGLRSPNGRGSRFKSARLRVRFRGREPRGAALGLVCHTHLDRRSSTYHLSVHADHVHLGCLPCWAVIQSPVATADPFVANLLTRHGFVADVKHMAIHGWCAACSAQATQLRNPMNDGRPSPPSW